MLKRFFLNLLSLVFHFVPRDKHLWVTGKTTSWDYVNAPPAFFDNSKYFFLYIVNNTTEKVYWLTSSKNELEMLRKMDLPVPIISPFNSSCSLDNESFCPLLCVNSANSSTMISKIFISSLWSQPDRPYSSTRIHSIRLLAWNTSKKDPL